MKLYKQDALNMLKSYQENLIEQELAKRTINRYLYNVTLWLDNMPEIISKTDIINYKEDLKDIYKVGTINTKIMSINQYLKYLNYNDLKIKCEKVTYRIDLNKILTVNEYFILLEYCREHKKYKMFYLMKVLANTGIRISELKYITLENIRRGQIEIENKRKHRTIYFSDNLQELIEDYCTIARINKGYVFRGRDKIKLIDSSTVNKDLKKLAEKTGIRKDGVYPHAFRHLFAKQFMKINGNIFELADILGHSNVETTRIYTKSSGAEKRESLDKLGL